MKQLKGTSILMVVLLVGVAALVGFGAYSYISSNNESSNNDQSNNENETVPEIQYATVSGIVDYSGLKPQGGDQGAVRILQRRSLTDEQFQDTGVVVPLADNAKWMWDKAVMGVTYDFRADLYVSEPAEMIAKSDVTTVTAPSSDDVLVLDVTWDMIPDEVAEEYPVTISGMATVNGYIPSGAKIVGYGKRADLENEAYQTGKTYNAAKTVNWEYNQALNGRKYSFYAIMYDSASNVIGTSSIVTKAAPFTDGNITINSDASAPAEKATISGKVKISGSFPSGTEVDIHVRRTGDDSYTTVDSVEAVTNTQWSWSDAVQGVEYDVKAVVDLPDSGDDPESDRVTVKAPASDIVLKIDTGIQLAKPENRPTVKSCTEEDSGWTAVLKYSGIQSAKQFWVQVGTDTDSPNLIDKTYPAPDANNSLEVKVKVDKDKDNYTRYSYSQCSDCGKGDSFSKWSDGLQFACPND